jgi:hypothetical protein
MRWDGARSSTAGSTVPIPAACSNLVGAVLMEMEAGARRASRVVLGSGGGEQEQATNPYSHGRTCTRDAAAAASSGAGVPVACGAASLSGRETSWRAAAEGTMGGGLVLELRLSEQEAPWAAWWRPL